MALIKNKAFSKEKVVVRTVPKFSLQTISVLNRVTLNMIEGSDPLKWEDFNSDYTSSTMDHKAYKELCREHD